jgi:VanZ family protein
MEVQRIPFKKFIPAIAWFIVVAVLTLMPGNDLPKVGWLTRIKYFDKIIHIGLFGVLMFLFCLPFIKAPLPFSQKINRCIKIALVVSLWGLTIEFIQKYCVPGRDFELLDWAADSLGVLISLWLGLKLMPATRQAKKLPAE